MNWIITAVIWIVAIFMVTRHTISTRLLGIGVAILAGALLGIAEYNRGRMHGRIENGVQLGSAVLPNLASAVQATLEGIIKSNRLDTTGVSTEHRAAFSNALELMGKKKNTDANQTAEAIGASVAPQPQH